MVDLSKRACLYVLMCAAFTLVWTQEQICLWICLWIRLVGPPHLYHPLHSWDFSHSWDFYCHCFYNVTSLIGYHYLLVSINSFSLVCWLNLWYWCYDWVSSLSSFCVVIVNQSTNCIPRRCCGSLWFVHFSSTWFPYRWREFFSVIPEPLCYLYSAAMAKIFLCASWTIMLLLFRGDGVYFLWFLHISYCASCTSLLCSCKMQISSNIDRIPWCLILYCILVALPCGSSIFFPDSCWILVLLYSLLVYRCDSMLILLIFMAAHLLICGLCTPGIFCSHTFPEPFCKFLVCLQAAIACLCQY